MKFNTSADLQYRAASDGTMILNIHALRSPTQSVLSETLEISPFIAAEELMDVNGENRLIRLNILEPTDINIAYRAIVDNNFRPTDVSYEPATPLSDIDPNVLCFLYPSRYCQSDKLSRLANNLFGKIDTDYERVIALTNWINQNVEYISGSTDSHTSAFDTVTEQAGVCRDFAHLGIALCRALTIPARYFTGYAYQLYPQDFHACFEAYISGQWVLFDATRLAPLNGLIKIATGRDAADTSTANLFGDIQLTSIIVDCQLAEENFEPYYR
jgi:transglutaminase-like putative cysteine protease